MGNAFENPKSKTDLIIAHEDDENVRSKKKRQRKKDKCLNCKQKGHLKRECPELSEERRKELQELVEMKIERKGHGTGRKKNKRKSEDQNVNDNDKHCKKNNKRAKYEEDSEQLQSHKTNKSNHVSGKNSSANSRGKAVNSHKKILKDRTGTVVGVGEGLFQGFRVKEQDVKRLQKLQKQLKSDKTLKDEDLNETLKRERRKAERELAKANKMVCYNCRKHGHVLADCPDAKTVPGVDAKTRKVHAIPD